MLKSFMSSDKGTVNIVASSTTASAALDVFSSAVRVANTGTVPVFIRFGGSAVVATTGNMPVLPGTVEVFTKGAYDRVAAITASGTATIYFTAGEGL